MVQRLNQGTALPKGGIFISYAAEDRERAKALAHTLEQRGWSVWWDRKIPLGESFDEAIEEALADSRCVLVLWTKVSTASRWVRAEASEAAARGVLIPVLFEPDVRIPLEFKLLQAANLGDWHDDPDHPEFRGLIAHVEAMLGPAGASRSGQKAEGLPPGTDAPHGPARQGGEPVPRSMLRDGVVDDLDARRTRDRAVRGGPARRAALALILIPGVVVTLGLLALTGLRTPTRVQLDALVDRASFTLAGDAPVDVPDQPLSFRSLRVEDFDRVAFTPARLARGPRGEPRQVSGAKRVLLNGTKGYRSMLMIAGVDPSAPVAGRVEAISVEPQSRVTVALSSESSRGFMLRIDGQDLATNVLPAGTLEIIASNATVDGIDGLAADGDSARLEVALPPDSPYIQIDGARPSFALGVTLAGSDTVRLVGRAPVEGIELLKQGTRGEVQSALVADGQIRYVDYPEIPPVRLRAGDFVGIGELEGASLNRLESRAGAGGIALLLEGVAGRLETSSTGVKRDHRLTLLETFWHGSRATILLVAAACVLSIAIGIYRFYTLMSADR